MAVGRVSHLPIPHRVAARDRSGRVAPSPSVLRLSFCICDRACVEQPDRAFGAGRRGSAGSALNRDAEIGLLRTFVLKFGTRPVDGPLEAL